MITSEGKVRELTLKKDAPDILFFENALIDACVEDIEKSIKEGLHLIKSFSILGRNVMISFMFKNIPIGSDITGKGILDTCSIVNVSKTLKQRYEECGWRVSLDFELVKNSCVLTFN